MDRYIIDTARAELNRRQTDISRNLIEALNKRPLSKPSNSEEFLGAYGAQNRSVLDVREVYTTMDYRSHNAPSGTGCTRRYVFE
ncbi:MAG: hypothetical protein LBB21_00390 [Holosporaceae bacterium]|jgi:hypothetical protein|nr:hypothetical protein [Holosporaceae bacterium]